MQNRMLAFMATKKLSKFRKGFYNNPEINTEVYEFPNVPDAGNMFCFVNAEEDKGNQNMFLVGVDLSKDMKSFKPCPRRENWHFTPIHNILWHNGKGDMYMVSFQYMYAEFEYMGSLRCVVWEMEEGQEGDEIFNTDVDSWEEIETFLS